MHLVESYHKMGRVNSLAKDNTFITIQRKLQVCFNVIGDFANRT